MGCFPWVWWWWLLLLLLLLGGEDELLGLELLGGDEWWLWSGGVWGWPWPLRFCCWWWRALRWFKWFSNFWCWASRSWKKNGWKKLRGIEPTPPGMVWRTSVEESLLWRGDGDWVPVIVRKISWVDVIFYKILVLFVQMREISNLNWTRYKYLNKK